MNKIYLLLMLFCLMSQSGKAQINTGVIHPFSHGSGLSQKVTTAADTSGTVWFATRDSMGTAINITNEYHTSSFSINISGFFPPQIHFISDSRNDLWLYYRTNNLFRIHNSTAQSFNLNVPDSIHFYIESITMADNHFGTDYFLYQTRNWTTHTDSLYLAAFDGTTQTNINLASVIANINATTSSLGIFTDHSGNVYIVDSAVTYKYDGSVWSTSPISFGNMGALSQYNLEDIVCTQDNDILVNDHSTQIWKVDSSGQVNPIYNCGAGNLLISSFAIARDGSLWMLNEWGLLKYNGDSFIRQNVYGNFSHSTCYEYGASFSFDRSGYIFVPADCDNTVFVYSLVNFNYFEGTVFLDANSNGIKDSNEMTLPNMIVSQTPDNAVANTDTAGQYKLLFLFAQAHTLSFTPPQYYQLTTPATYTVNPDSTVMCCYNFGFAPIDSVVDMQINVTASSFIPGFATYHWLTYHNIGTGAMSDTISYRFDPNFRYISSSPPADIVQGNVVKWAYQNLQPFEMRTIRLQLLLDTSTSVGVALFDTAYISPITSDNAPTDNTFTLQQTTVSSFDPNHKTVSPSDFTAPGETLSYTVYFQNTGTAPAQNIVVNDTLSSYLNFSTFKLTGSSSPVSYTIKGKGIVQFTFANVQLPDSASDPSGSIGFVKYSIQAKSNITYGTDVKNTAFIYFDFNPAIKTNTTNSFYRTVALNETTNDDATTIYPNPASSRFFMKGLAKGQRIEIYDAIGQSVIRTTVYGDVAEVNVAPLAEGIYFVRLLDQHSSCLSVRKIIISK